MIFARLINLIIFKLPYISLYEVTRVSRGNQREVWNKLPFRNLRVPTILPDGNVLICSWEDKSYEWDIYHDSSYDRFFKPEREDTVVDAGAHVGFYSLKAAKEVGNKGRIVAIEPEDKNYELLSQNIRINRYKNIIAIKRALSDFEGKAQLFLKARSFSHSLVKKVWVTPIVGTAEVAVTTLDDLLERLDIKKVDLLKINAEGAELNVLKGSRRVMAMGGISKIVLTTHPPHKEEASKIARYLMLFGYRTKVVDDAKILYAFLN